MPDSQADILAQKDSELQQYKSMASDLSANIAAMKQPVWQKYEAAQIAYYNEQIAYTNLRVEAFEWQHFASTVMLWVAVAVVVSGLALSTFQLCFAMFVKLRAEGATRPATPGAAGAAAVNAGQDSMPDLKTDFAIDLAERNVKLTSSVVGIVILGMSLAFVLIFANQIYPTQAVQTVVTTVPLTVPESQQ